MPLLSGKRQSRQDSLFLNASHIYLLLIYYFIIILTKHDMLHCTQSTIIKFYLLCYNIYEKKIKPSTVFLSGDASKSPLYAAPRVTVLSRALQLAVVLLKTEKREREKKKRRKLNRVCISEFSEKISPNQQRCNAQ